MPDLTNRFCAEGAFAPETVRLLTDALDAAWAALEGGGARFATPDEAGRAREALALHIIQSAKHGERDQRKLADGALQQLAKRSPNAIIVR
jgi:hypothetical protein